jgi:hypothetical protein
MALILASAMGGILGVVLAAPQWRVLRQYVRRAAWWLIANMLAWACGMPIIFHRAGGVPEGATVAHILTTMLITIALAGGVVGAVHGIVLVILVRFDATTKGAP